MPHYQL